MNILQPRLNLASVNTNSSTLQLIRKVPRCLWNDYSTARQLVIIGTVARDLTCGNTTNPYGRVGLPQGKW